MQNWNSEKNFSVSLIIIVMISNLLLFVSGCRNNISNGNQQENSKVNRIFGSEEYTAYIKSRSFQNIDSTWGFTIFVNSKPFLHHRRIPVPRANSGFKSKSDAEKVGGLFVKMIQEGNYSPEISKSLLDSLGVLLY